MTENGGKNVVKQNANKGTVCKSKICVQQEIMAIKDKSCTKLVQLKTIDPYVNVCCVCMKGKSGLFVGNFCMVCMLWTFSLTQLSSKEHLK